MLLVVGVNRISKLRAIYSGDSKSRSMVVLYYKNDINAGIIFQLTDYSRSIFAKHLSQTYYLFFDILSTFTMATYTIKQGDTLFEIAKKHNISLQTLEAANPGVNPKNLQTGQVIKLPGGQQHPPKGIPGSQGGTNGGGDYVKYHGPASGYPSPSQWATYDFLWKQNSRLMKFNDSDSEIAQIHQAIEKVASESGVDVRVILCIIMQESGGNVRVQTTNNGVRNPGIMQSHNGVAFDPANPAASILQMVRDGTEGTKHGSGLKQLRAKYGNYYTAFRAYNSGSVNEKELNDPVGATADYVQETANRLMGHSWNGM